MSFSEYFPIFNKLTSEEQSIILKHATLRKIPKGTLLHNGSDDCLGLLLVRTGQLRAYIYSDEGREITVYRLFERDMCILSAACMLRSIQFDITIRAEKDTEAWLIPPEIYKNLMEKSAVIANYTNEIMGERFTSVMWLVEQIMFKSFDKRLATFLVDECNIEESSVLKMTHEQIASHLGTAREVVTRMLKYFQNEGVVKLTRGTIEILDMKKLRELSE